MKKSLFIYLILLVVASCAKNVTLGDREGMGQLSMKMRVDSRTRSTFTDEELLENAQVNIYKADFSGLVRSYTYSTMPSSFYLAADSYRVDVLAGEIVEENPVVASWERKSYKGSAAFDILPYDEKTVEVVAGISNAVTHIEFDPTIVQNFNPGYTFTIGLEGTDASLVYDAEKSGSEGYFIISGMDEPAFTWTFDGVLAKKGTAFTKTGSITGLQPGRLYKMNVIYTVRDGEFNFTIHVDPVIEEVDDMIVFEPVSTGLAASDPAEIWACRATVHADVDVADSEGASVQFAYSQDGESWTKVDGVQDTEATWLATFTGLTPSTEYTCRLLINDAPVGDDMTFKTDVAKELPNGSFEYVSKVSGQSFYKFYDPSCGIPGCTEKFWGSGNGDEENAGSGSMNFTITEIDTGSKVDGNQSVLMATKYAVVKLAAGNLFTGYFAGMVSTKGGKVCFGRPWTSRPSALRFQCKYTTGKMDHVDGSPQGVSLKENETIDRAQIKFALGTWDNKKYGGSVDCPILVNTTDESTFVDFNTDESTIAYGDLIIYNDGIQLNGAPKESKAVGDWNEYTIPLQYFDTDTFPTHIVISFASSQYGDYFSGSTSSRLWIDAVELVYE